MAVTAFFVVRFMLLVVRIVGLADEVNASKDDNNWSKTMMAMVVVLKMVMMVAVREGWWCWWRREWQWR